MTRLAQIVADRAFGRFFKQEDEEGDSGLEYAQEVIQFAECVHYKRFMGWLEAEALKPMRISENSGEMVQQAVRANTVREIREKLTRDVSTAADAIAAFRGSENE